MASSFASLGYWSSFPALTVGRGVTRKRTASPAEVKGNTWTQWKLPLSCYAKCTKERLFPSKHGGTAALVVPFAFARTTTITTVLRALPVKALSTYQYLTPAVSSWAAWRESNWLPHHAQATSTQDTKLIGDESDAMVGEGCSAGRPTRTHEDDNDEQFQCTMTEKPLMGNWLSATVFIARRVVYLTCLFIPLSGLVFVWAMARSLRELWDKTLYLDSWRFKTYLQWVDELAFEGIWKYLYWAVARAGPCYIKFVQWVATRADLFPISVCQRCAHFYCCVEPHPYPYTVALLEEVLGHNWQQQFWIDPHPIGSGGIAQVYRGVLRKNDGCFAEIALKVLHPCIQQCMITGKRPTLRQVLNVRRELSDLQILIVGAKLIEYLPGLRWLAPYDTMSQFRDMMLSQIDLLQEARNLERFRRNFSKPSSRRQLARLKSRVVVPKVYHELCSSSVLVESFEDGLVLGTWMRLTRQELDQRTSAYDPTSEDVAWTTKTYFLSYLDGGDYKAHTSDLTPLNTLSPLNSVRQLVAFAPHVTRTAVTIVHDAISSFYHSLRRGIDVLLEKAGLPRRISVTNHEATFGLCEHWARVASVGLSLFLQMVFSDNFFHADLHPGNLIIRFREERCPAQEHVFPFWRNKQCEKDGNYHYTEQELAEKLQKRYQQDKNRWDPLFSGRFSDVDFEIVLLDCGLAAALSVREFINFTDLARYICLGEGYNAGKIMVDRARRQECTNPDGFCRDVDALIRTFHETSGGSLTLSRARLGECFAKMLQTACHYRVELDPRFVSLIIAIIVLEGVGRQLDPNIDLLRSALPHVKDLVVDATLGSNTMPLKCRCSSFE